MRKVKFVEDVDISFYSIVSRVISILKAGNPFVSVPRTHQVLRRDGRKSTALSTRDFPPSPIANWLAVSLILPSCDLL